MEKLIEEIRQIIEGCVWTRLEWDGSVEPEDIPLRDVKTGIDKRDVVPIIARIGKAYADGMKLPGEVDRWKGGKMMVRPYFSLSHAVKGLELIAFRQEGTGKEEEG